MDHMTIFIKEATNSKPIQMLEHILMQMNGIERALVDTEDGEVKVTYDRKQIAQEQIINHIKQHGMYPVEQ
ncbi:heavy-metal-associated domain-containing protein [Bacillus ginsengihumi]|uniref:Heavy-metal-associated domain-containing protein n=1 Tax=Heyndrickxia ginsengihumi TaxID=363870 RepID=A0A0A6V827_9BACI|nr:heavy metal-associated domain-containing protein [Heyndrickxia ginsengihumi]KHD84215.1 metal ABC transporter ATPase [Heyndrickxia ginsengihumi]MBE6184056.1 heavy-metal-associated domain-containing protein [Bacillus sp. (in: firmicutes)]MCM3024577.1 heavy-metal-associated domain-containing protein [Heyndrickxia ginsengihumi]NEY18786.1 heavy-metal-associated domain-containing protein [Heyndrickxia ginsengihumi]